MSALWFYSNAVEVTTTKRYFTKFSELAFLFSQLNALNMQLLDFHDEISFENRPKGISTLSKMMEGISKASYLSRLYKNHLVRTTVITLLSEADMPNCHILAISGHSIDHTTKGSQRSG